MKIQKVGVVGCGLMGSGIAQACAQAGYQVVVSEINDELLNRGLGMIDSSLKRSVEKGRLSQEDKDACLSRIKGTTDMNDFSDRDIVIEAAVENLELKKKIFTELDKICPTDTILASNTSALSVLDIAIATGRPAKMLGLHFFNPVAVMKLLEMVRTIATSDETIEACRDFGTLLGKTVVVAQDTRGFIVNRLSTPLMLNAMRMLEANTATKEDIDNAMMLGMNHPMGPLALADLIGLDSILSATTAMYEEFKDSQFAPPPLLKQMVTAGWLGRKAGKGFFDYSK